MQSSSEDRTNITVLMDIYGPLLTERQLEMLDLHYNSDLSLSEISEELSISRQAAHDGLRKSRAILLEYEEKLGLEKQFIQQEALIREAEQVLKTLQEQFVNLKDNSSFVRLSELVTLLKQSNG